MGKVQGILIAIRPKTLTASLVPILVATALAERLLGAADLLLSLAALATAVFIQIGTNFVNDAMDYLKGADTKERLGTLRVTQSGILTAQQVLFAAFVSFTLAFFASIPLIIVGGGALAFLLAVAIVCGVSYTAGPYPLAYHGLGDLFVLIFFGFAAPAAVFYVQGGSIGWPLLLGSLQIGLLAVSLIAINNLRDINTDRQAGKNTLAVRWGERFSRSEITACLLLPPFLGSCWQLLQAPAAAFLPCFSLPLAFVVAAGIWRHPPGREYNRFLGMASLNYLLFGVLLSLGLIL